MRRLTVRWTKLALENAPLPRSSHGISAVGGQAHVFGGESRARQAIDSDVFSLLPPPPGKLQPQWWKFSPARCPEAPVPRVGHAQSGVRDKLLVFGGRTDVSMGEGALDDLWSWVPATGVWERLEAQGSPPSPRSFHAASSSGDKLYIFGGCGAQGRLADLHEYDTATNRWTALPSPPDLAGRGGALLEAAPDGRALWAGCGFTGAESNELLRFDLASSSWERVPSGWLRPRSVCASVSLQYGSGGAVLLFGGEVAPSDAGHEGAGSFASDLIAIDAADGTPLDVAIEEGPTPEARGWAAATAISDNDAILFGGLAGSDESPRRLGDAWRLSVRER